MQRTTELIMRCEVLRRRGVQGSSLSCGHKTKRMVVPPVAVETRAGVGVGWHPSLWWSVALASLMG